MKGRKKFKKLKWSSEFGERGILGLGVWKIRLQGNKERERKRERE